MSVKRSLSELEINKLSDNELQEHLELYGVSTGPIVVTTRQLYQKKLAAVMDSHEIDDSHKNDMSTEESCNDDADEVLDDSDEELLQTFHQRNIQLQTERPTEKNSLYKWRQNEIKLLLSFLLEKKEMVHHVFQKKEALRMAQEKLMKNGHNIPLSVVINKWQSLLQTFRRITSKQNYSGDGAIHWDWYNMMDELVGQSTEGVLSSNYVTNKRLLLENSSTIIPPSSASFSSPSTICPTSSSSPVTPISLHSHSTFSPVVPTLSTGVNVRLLESTIESASKKRKLENTQWTPDPLQTEVKDKKDELIIDTLLSLRASIETLNNTIWRMDVKMDRTNELLESINKELM